MWINSALRGRLIWGDNFDCIFRYPGPGVRVQVCPFIGGLVAPLGSGAPIWLGCRVLDFRHFFFVQWPALVVGAGWVWVFGCGLWAKSAIVSGGCAAALGADNSGDVVWVWGRALRVSSMWHIFGIWGFEGRRIIDPQQSRCRVVDDERYPSASANFSGRCGAVGGVVIG